MASSFRLSSYTIFIDLENEDDKTMIIHGYTGAIDIVTSGIVSFLKSDGYLHEQNAPFSTNTWNHLVQRGYITEKDADQENEFVKRMADAFYRRDKLFSCFTFLVSYDCDFRCPYCYEAGVSDHGRHWTKQAFTKEMVDKAYSAIEEIAPHQDLRLKKITLYGGEPLLPENLEIVRYIIEQGKQKGLVFDAVTNGYSLNLYEDLLGLDSISEVQITVDGDKEWHNQRRFHFEKGGTFDKILKNIGIALEKGIRVNIRANTDKRNFDSLKTLKQRFKDLGYLDNKNFLFYSGWLFQLEETINDKNTSKAKIDSFEFDDFCQQFEDPSIGITCSTDATYKRVYNAISKGKYLSLDSRGCAAQGGAYVFDPYGELYCCLQTVGRKPYVIGNYAGSQISWDSKELIQWHQHIGMSNSCHRCAYAFFCRGGCIADNRMKINYGDNYSKCRNFKRIFHKSVNKAYHSYFANKNDLPE